MWILCRFNLVFLERIVILCIEARRRKRDKICKKEDRFVMAELVLVILKDMELPFVKEIGEAKTLEILADAMLEPDYRYGFAVRWSMRLTGRLLGSPLDTQTKKRRRSISL